MQDLLDHHELVAAEFLFPQPVYFTYKRADCRSHIDHIVIPSTLRPRVTGCQILPPHTENLSPHQPLVCQVLVAAAASTGMASSAAAWTASATCTEVLDWDCFDRIEIYKQTLTSLLDD